MHKPSLPFVPQVGSAALAAAAAHNVVGRADLFLVVLHPLHPYMIWEEELKPMGLFAKGVVNQAPKLCIGKILVVVTHSAADVCGAFAVKSCKGGLEHPGFYFAHSLLRLEGHRSFVRTAPNTQAVTAH